jgi:hypothetical protein
MILMRGIHCGDEREIDFVCKAREERRSSMALSPPPTTMTFFPLKKKPSHVAQAETP